MDYESFRNTVLKELKDFYGKDAVVTVRKRKDNAGQHYEGIDIFMQDAADQRVHSINFSLLYEKYAAGEMDLYDCVESIYREREGGGTE